MATVIDSLLITLGIDASGVTKGQKDTSNALKKTSDDAARTAKELEARGKQAAQFFSQIKTQVIGLFAVFTAGKGIDSFVSQLVDSDAAVGRLAKNVGMSTESLSAWQGVAERAGGSASGISGSIQHISTEMQKLAMTGTTEMLPFLAMAHVNLQKFLDTSTPMSEKLLELADAFKGMDPQRAQAIGAGLGLDQGTINVLMQGRQAVEALLAEQMKIGVANESDAKSAQQLQAAWRALGEASTDLGRKILTSLSPYIQMLSRALLDLSEWAATHRPMVEAMFIGLAAAVTAFALVLAAPIAGMAALSAGIGVAVAAIAVLYDDWKAWTEGGKSEFGGFWKFFSDVMGLIKALFTGDADDIRKAWEAMVKDLGTLLSHMVDLVKNLGPVLLAAFKSAFTGAFSWAEGRAQAIWDAITGKGSSQSTSAAPAPSKSSSGGSSVLADAMRAAKAAESKYGIPASVTLAQFALESGNGAHMPAGSNNPFGIKAKAGQPYVEAQTNEFINGKMERVSQRFAKFDSLSDAFDAHAKLLATASPYAAARTHSNDPKAFANALTGVYATDPQYGAKLNAIMARNNSGSGGGSSTDVQIGQLTIQTKATDATGIAKDIGPALQKYAFSAQSNAGLS